MSIGHYNMHIENIKRYYTSDLRIGTRIKLNDGRFYVAISILYEWHEANPRTLLKLLNMGCVQPYLLYKG